MTVNESEYDIEQALRNSDLMFQKLDEYLSLAFEFMDGDNESQIVIASLQQDLNKINDKDNIQ